MKILLTTFFSISLFFTSLNSVQVTNEEEIMIICSEDDLIGGNHSISNT